MTTFSSLTTFKLMLSKTFLSVLFCHLFSPIVITCFVTLYSRFITLCKSVLIFYVTRNVSAVAQFYHNEHPRNAVNMSREIFDIFFKCNK